MLNETTRSGTTVLQLLSKYALKFSVWNLFKSWQQRSERMFMLCFHIGACFKPITFKRKQINSADDSSVLLCTWRLAVISFQVKINQATAGDYSRAHFYSIKIIYYLKIQLMFSLLSSRKEKHNFTDLSSFETFFSFHDLIFQGTTLDNKSEKLCGWGVPSLAFLFFLITARIFKRSPALCQGF